MIDRNQFVEELKLREHIRKAIKIIREKKVDKAKALLEEENRLRSVIRKLINEKEGEGDESTGISFLRQDLKKILINNIKSTDESHIPVINKMLHIFCES